ncbi:hypothetical protein B645_13120 [Enterococcus hirae 88-15-E09]|nr:hypothetical protein F522_12725 [Enterococcus hirae 81-15-F4]OWW57497.1 hypothetical protein B645_13120 [Enterococcus hirae 88-15-E09]
MTNFIKNLGQNELHSVPDLILHNPIILIDKELFYLLKRVKIFQFKFYIFLFNPFIFKSNFLATMIQDFH